MKLIIFDVEDSACALIVCPNGYSMMIDCGCHTEKICPVDQILSNRDRLGMIDYMGYPLTLLHITHPDNDHVNNSEKLTGSFAPYLVSRRKYEHFSIDQDIPEDYKKHIDLKYRGNPIIFDLWGFEENKIFSIPMDIVKTVPELKIKEKNNSSVLKYVKSNGVSVLFGGDLEKAGWDWLVNNDPNFANTMAQGLTILIAPHHGHLSGFPQSLFNLTGSVQVIVHSKGGEGDIEGTNVANQYTDMATGINYLTPDNQAFSGKVLTTRSNGNIVIDAVDPGRFYVHTEKASPNHESIGV